MANCIKVLFGFDYEIILKSKREFDIIQNYNDCNKPLICLIRFDFKILARGETDAGYYYEGNDFSQVKYPRLAIFFIFLKQHEPPITITRDHRLYVN